MLFRSYGSFLAVVALLASERPAVAPLLLLATLSTQVIAAWGGWTDEQYVAMSAATLAALTVLLWRFAAAPRHERDSGPREASDARR